MSKIEKDLNPADINVEVEDGVVNTEENLKEGGKKIEDAEQEEKPTVEYKGEKWRWAVLFIVTMG